MRRSSANPAPLPRSRGGALRRGASQRVGLVVAALIGAAGAGVVAYVAVTGPASKRPPRTGDLLDAGPPPTITDLGSGGALGPGQFQNAGGIHMEFADRADPSRVAMLLTSEQAELKEARRYAMTKPVATQYQRDGGVWVFSADRGEAHIPDEQRGGRPESARLEGNATIRVFEPGADASRPDVEHADPAFVGVTDEITYNGTFGEVLIPGVLRLDSPQLAGTLENTTLRFSESTQRVEFLRVQRSDGLTISPAKDRRPDAQREPAPGAEDPGTPMGEPGETRSEPAPPAPGPPVESLYHVTLTGSVVVTQGDWSISSEHLDIWLRLFDNRLREGAIAGATPRRSAAGWPQALPTPLALGVATMTLAAAPEEPSPAPPEAAPVRVYWTGPLEVHPLESAPLELARDDVFVRFRSAGAERVTFRDAASGARAEARSMDYGAGSRRLALAASDEDPARLTLPGSGVAMARNISMDLAAGLVAVDGPGWIEGLAPADPPAGDAAARPDARQRLSWSRGAEFDLALEDGRITSRLTGARPRGDVLARDAAADAEIRGEEIDARFAPSAADRDRPLIERLAVRGGASIRSGERGSLSGDSLDIAFVPGEDTRRATPARVEILGHARAEQEGQSLAGDSLVASLTTRDGTLAVDHARAEGSVRYADDSGSSAQGDVLNAFPGERRVEILGPNAWIARATTRVTGPQIALDGKSQGITVFGPGSLSHEDRAADAGPRSTLLASWTRQMSFADDTGRAECSGEVRARWETFEPSPGDAPGWHLSQRATLAGERLSLALEPAGAREPVPTLVQGDPGQSAPPRRLLSGELLSSNADGSGTEVAKVEVRRFSHEAPASDAAPPRPERLLYLESDVVHLSSPQRDRFAVSTPGAGRLLLSDRRPTRTSDEPAPNEPELARGDALFQWSGSMSSDQGDNQLTLAGDVKMRQSRPGAERLSAQLACDSLTATLSPPDAAGGGGELQRVDARGQAWFQYDQREIQGAQLVYDAQRSFVEATSDAGGTVSIFDRRAASPVSARSVSWNLATGEMDVREPGTLVAPR